MLFPGGRVPLRIFEQRYLEMAKACLRDGSLFGVCLIREGSEVGGPAVPAQVGCTAGIEHWDMAQLGVLEIVARGRSRFRTLSHRVEPDGLLRASVELLKEDRDGAVAEAHRGCVRLLERIIREHPGLLEPPYRLDSSAWVSDRLAELLPLPLELKQELLEMSDAPERLGRLAPLLRPAP